MVVGGQAVTEINKHIMYWWVMNATKKDETVRREKKWYRGWRKCTFF